MSTGNEKILILGLGGAGGKVVSRIASQHISGLDTAVIDTDQDALQTMEPNVQSLFAGSCLSWGQGAKHSSNFIYSVSVSTAKFKWKRRVTSERSPSYSIE